MAGPPRPGGAGGGSHGADKAHPAACNYLEFLLLDGLVKPK